ncbi:MAG: type II toxin-antitoxin system RelE/ParE family toxin [Ignavibacteriae bacterium]|nr:type II toxin-antitoxin system RelE/ParE family toxin [Ignavibacteriota bacterium]
MNYNVKSIDVFERQAERLKKKYASLKGELTDLILSLQQNPRQGIYIGDNCYKIRLAIASKGKGKSGGARMITHVLIEKENVYLLTIFDKSEKENMTERELRELIKRI